MYGIWLRGRGWLRGKDIFADYSLTKAEQVAYLVGGSVRFIDKSIQDLEQLYLERESRTLWHILSSLFKTNSSKSR